MGNTHWSWFCGCGGTLILFFLIRFTNWKAEIWRKSGGNLAEIFSPQVAKYPHMWKCRPKHTNPLQSSLSQIITGGSILIVSEPDGTQTHDLQNRNLALYSTKLRVHTIILTHVPNNRLPGQAIRITMQSYKDFIDFSHIGHDRPNIISVF